MNRRLRVCLIALLGSGCLLLPAPAQDMPLDGIPPTGAPPVVPAPPPAPVINIPDIPFQMKSGSPTVEERQNLSKWVGLYLEVIATGDPARQKIARDKLISTMPRPTDPNVAAAFIEAYAKAMDDEIVKALKANPPLRNRLILAIVVAKSADRADTVSYPLADATELLLQDPSEAIVLWGMKSAKVVLPHLLALPVGQYKPLLDLIVPAALKFPGPVLEEAYFTLTLTQLELAKSSNNVAKAAPRIRVVLPHVLRLLNSRLADWGKGLPTYPLADSHATTFLSIKGVWDLQTPPQQKQSVTMILDLLTKAAPAFNAAALDSPEKRELYALIKRGAQALGVIGVHTNETTVQSAAKVMDGIIPATRADALNTWIAGLTPAVQAMKIMKAPSAPGAAGTAGTPAPVGAAR